jgi:hypothetical protein
MSLNFDFPHIISIHFWASSFSRALLCFDNLWYCFHIQIWKF